MLPFSHIVQDPTVPMEQHYLMSLQPQRTCSACFDELSRPTMNMQRSPSVQSVMMDCPVCGVHLGDFGEMEAQEQHVQSCLSANTSTAMTGVRYVGKQCI